MACVERKRGALALVALALVCWMAVGCQPAPSLPAATPAPEVRAATATSLSLSPTPAPPPATPSPEVRAPTATPLSLSPTPAPPPATPSPGVSYARDIQPIFGSYCVKCHRDGGLFGPPPNGLRLTSYEDLIKGGISGQEIVPGQPERSRLAVALGYGGVAPVMPFDAPGSVPAEAVQRIVEWIRAGAPKN